MTTFRRFTDIGQFHNLVYAANKFPEYYPTEITYQAKVKLHGTNATIGMDNGKIFAQQRNGIAEDGHYGFALFTEGLAEKFANVPDCYIYGEWVGAGIQGGAAVCTKLPSKRFCIFAIWVLGYYYVDPDVIQQFLCDNTHMTPLELKNSHIHIIDWANEGHSTVELRESDNAREFIANQEKLVQAVDGCDPWMKSEFDMEGVGEGLVYYPVCDSDYIDAEDGDIQKERYTTNWHDDVITDFGIHEDVFSKLVFKAKGQSHEAKAKSKKPAIQLSPEELKSQNDFVEHFVTEERMAQIVHKFFDAEFDMKNVGQFLKELGLDIIKESQDELEANDMEWKDVQKKVQHQAKSWFIQEAKKI